MRCPFAVVVVWRVLLGVWCVLCAVRRCLVCVCCGLVVVRCVLCDAWRWLALLGVARCAGGDGCWLLCGA